MSGVLQLVEIRLLDHVIITAHTCVSLAERGCC
ncbi:JAB domain-containing protein [Aeromonas caviae]